jgi:hypothetical protein
VLATSAYARRPARRPGRHGLALVRDPPNDGNLHFVQTRVQIDFSESPFVLTDVDSPSCKR